MFSLLDENLEVVESQEDFNTMTSQGEGEALLSAAEYVESRDDVPFIGLPTTRTGRFFKSENGKMSG